MPADGKKRVRYQRSDTKGSTPVKLIVDTVAVGVDSTKVIVDTEAVGVDSTKVNRR